jgi:plastocyanin
MKKTRHLSLLMTLIFSMLLVVNSQATVWTVNVQNFTFDPASLPDVKIGDVVKFVWVSGNHTTTSTTIPSGAETWDSPINIEFPQFEYTPTVTGTYNYKCTPHASMGMTGSFVVSTAVGIGEQEIAPEINLAPNPFKDFLKMEFADHVNLKIKELNVYNITGRVAYASDKTQGEAVESVTIDLGTMPSGFYFVRITDQNDKIYTRKVLKE